MDDEIVVARALERTLTQLGYGVAPIAASAQEAVALMAECAPDLVLMDVNLRDDMIAAGEIDERRRRWPIPVVVMTSEEEGEGLQLAVPTESYGYIVKPFTPRELRLTIELTLCRHDAATAVHDLEDNFFAISIDLLCFLDFNGHFRKLNPAWERTLGFTRRELMSRPFIEFVHPDDRERTLAQNSQVRGGGKALSFENRYLCKDGSYRWLRWNAAPDSTDEMIYSVARDITAAKLAHDEREQLVRDLQAAMAEVKTLREILPICSYCRRVRDDENYWDTVESYISRNTKTQFSHGICPSCLATEVGPQLDVMDRE